jgi:hypothetical protein
MFALPLKKSQKTRIRSHSSPKKSWLSGASDSTYLNSKIELKRRGQVKDCSQ